MVPKILLKIASAYCAYGCGIFKNETKYRYRYRYRPIAYIFLGLYIGIGLLSKIHYRSLPAWDIDVDIHVPTQHMHHFHGKNGARPIFESNNFILHCWEFDERNDKDLGEIVVQFHKKRIYT